MASWVTDYITDNWNIRPQEWRAAQIEAKPETGEATVGLLARELKAEGMAEGMAMGEARGEARGKAMGFASGKADLLKRLLRGQFGPLPEGIESRIDRASPEELDAWGERFVGAPSLEAVFGGHPH